MNARPTIHTEDRDRILDRLDERAEWLSQYGCDENDVMTDAKGHEYIMEYREHGTLGEEGYEVDYFPVRLPEKLQKYYTPF